MRRRKNVVAAPTRIPSAMRVLHTPQELKAAITRAKRSEELNEKRIQERIRRYDAYSYTNIVYGDVVPLSENVVEISSERRENLS